MSIAVDSFVSLIGLLQTRTHFLSMCRYPLYKPLKILLELVILDDSCIPRDETQDMALNEIEKWVLQAGRLSPISALERYGRVIRGEICWRLARQKSRGHPSQIRLIEKGTKNSLDAMKTMKRDGQYAYMMKTAYVVSVSPIYLCDC